MTIDPRHFLTESWAASEVSVGAQSTEDDTASIIASMELPSSVTSMESHGTGRSHMLSLWTAALVIINLGVSFSLLFSTSSLAPREAHGACNHNSTEWHEWMVAARSVIALTVALFSAVSTASVVWAADLLNATSYLQLVHKVCGHRSRLIYLVFGLTVAISCFLYGCYCLICGLDLLKQREFGRTDARDVRHWAEIQRRWAGSPPKLQRALTSKVFRRRTPRPQKVVSAP